MTCAGILSELERLGTARNRKVYARHGIGGPAYGVSFGDLKKLCRQIRVDHGLARLLWATGNHDARVLATMIADPQQADGALLDEWAADLDNYVLTDALAAFAGRAPCAREKMEAWIASDEEWIGQLGWGVVAQLALHDATLSDDAFKPFIARIERDIHRAKNRVRHAMNNALIAIGTRSDALAAEAVAAARRIGKVEVDHGDTACRTPDAATYIEKARAHRRKHT